LLKTISAMPPVRRPMILSVMEESLRYWKRWPR
jgi:hypothetical protein